MTQSERFNRVDVALQVALDSAQCINTVLEDISGVSQNEGFWDSSMSDSHRDTEDVDTLDDCILELLGVQPKSLVFTTRSTEGMSDEEKMAYTHAYTLHRNNQKTVTHFIKNIMSGKLKVLFPPEVSDWYSRMVPEWKMFDDNGEEIHGWTVIHALARSSANRVVRNQPLATFTQIEQLEHDLANRYALALCCAGYYMHLVGIDLRTFTTKYTNKRGKEIESCIAEGLIPLVAHAVNSDWADFAYHHRRSERILDVRELIEFNEDQPTTTAKRPKYGKKKGKLKGGIGDRVAGNLGQTFKESEPVMPSPVLDAIRGIYFTDCNKTIFHNGKPMFGMLLHKAHLTHQEKSILSAIFLEGKSLREVGETLDIHFATIVHKRDKAFNKIRQYITNSDVELGLFMV